MGLPRIYYTADVSRDFSFPEELSAIEGSGRMRQAIMSETLSGVVAVQFEHFREEVIAVLDMMPRVSGPGHATRLYEDFEGQFHAFFGHASKGGAFSFARDSADVAETTVRVAVAAGATNIPVVSSTAFVIGQKYALDSVQDGWQREYFTVTGKDATSPPSLQVGTGFYFAYAVSDLVRSIGYFSKCEALGSAWPFTEDPPNAWSFRFAFRTYRGLVVA